MFQRASFSFLYGSALAKLGRGSVIFNSFRLDGEQNIAIGDKVLIQRNAWLYCVGINNEKATLSIGNGCTFGYNNHITSVREVIIGNSVLTANNVYISDNLHDYEDVNRPVIDQPVKFKGPVSIGDGCWIGENVCVIGAKIGRNCVIGANAVVNSDIPDYSVAVGIPARVIKTFDHGRMEWINITNKK